MFHLWFSDDFLPSILLQVKPSCVNPFMDSSIDSDHSWESHSTGSSGRGTQHSDKGSLCSAQRSGLTKRTVRFGFFLFGPLSLDARLFRHWWRQSLFNVSLLQVAWTCRSLRFPVTGSRSATRTGSKFKSPRPPRVPTGTPPPTVAGRRLWPRSSRRPPLHLRRPRPGASSRSWKGPRVAPPWSNRCPESPTSR